MKKNPLMFTFGLFAVIGIIFVIVGICVGNAMKIPEEDAIKTTATITRIESHRDSDGDTDHDVWVRYKVDGKTYEEEINSYSSSYREGKEIEVIYDKKNPSKVQTELGDKLFTWIFSGMGGLFAAIGIVGIAANGIRKSKKHKLEQSGSIIYANFDRVEENEMVVINGRHPFNIICSWNNPEDSKTYIFKSDDLYYDPTSAINSLGLTSFPVYIDMENMKNYSVDISAVEQKVVDLT